MAQSSMAPTLPIEVAYWNAHCQELVETYPNKLLIIQGEQVVAIFDDGNALFTATTQNPQAVQGLLCFTDRQDAVVSYCQYFGSGLPY